MTKKTETASIADLEKPPESAVKLVIWDLDDTFWNGTLSEGPVVAIPSNIQMLERLARRGIVSSVCSKNDFEQAKCELEKLGAWDYIVFPVIQWAPKGQAIADLIDRMNFRTENVVFIDDNPANLHDALYYNPDLNCCINATTLESWIDHSVLAGKADPMLRRLNAYKQLEKRDQSKRELQLSNTDFLRQSHITCEISYDIEPHLERVIELANRTNQLNFTKRRLDSDERVSEFVDALSTFGYQAGIVRVRDKYADYGIVGFFLIHATFKGKVYNHFVFSCRILNMGVEQYVDEFLRSPELTVQQPVANPVSSFDRVDWISANDGGAIAGPLHQHRILVVGGCDMLQFATYCSAHSVEFTNRAAGDLIVRFDDPAFFLGSIDEVRASKLRPQIPAPSADEMENFESALSKVDVIVLSLYEMLSTTYFRGKDGLIVRFFAPTLKSILASDRALWFVRNFQFEDSTFDERLNRVSMSVDSVLRRTDASVPVILLDESISIADLPDWEVSKRKRYNQLVERMCLENDRLHKLPASEIVRPEWAIDHWHYSRAAYLAMAQFVADFLGSAIPGEGVNTYTDQ